MVVICTGRGGSLSIKRITRVWNKKGILKDNLSFLTKPTKEVFFPLSDYDEKIINELKNGTSEIPCAGIAANQLGFNKKIFIGLTDYQKNKFEIFINPVIIEKSESSIQKGMESSEAFKDYIDSQLENGVDRGEQIHEGCLSMPGLAMSFDRYNKIKVKYQTEEGEDVIKELEGFYSRVFQHETDHLNGILIYDRLTQMDGGIMYDSRFYTSTIPQNLEKGMKDLRNWFSDSYSCPNLELKETVPHREGKWYMCNSNINPHSCTKNELQNFCATIERNFRNCNYFNIKK